MSDLQTVLDDELVALYDDIAEAQKQAINGDWSMRCDWFTDRAAALVSVGGNVPELRNTQMTVALYQRVTKRVMEAGE